MSRFVADCLVVLHLAFILFVVLGGFLTLRWPRIAWLHVPTAIWGALIEFTGWICPLTTMEKALREAVGGSTYSGGFITDYIVPVVYPPGLTPPMQLALGVGVIVINLLAYGLVWIRRRRRLAVRSQCC